jgi:hypothetical protein
MTMRSIAVACLVAAGFGGSGNLLACGDKFLVLSRGTRYERPAAARQPAAILVYANPGSGLFKAFANLRVEATLQKVGYRSTSVGTAADFDRALAQGKWDLVLVDVTDGQSVRDRLRGANAAILLPVLYKPTGAELTQAKRQFERALKAPTTNQSLLDAIDATLADTAKARTKEEGKPAR